MESTIRCCFTCRYYYAKTENEKRETYQGHCNVLSPGYQANVEDRYYSVCFKWESVLEYLIKRRELRELKINPLKIKKLYQMDFAKIEFKLVK